ncbi:MAG: arginine deiminase family protein [Kofleriaceae bacterium]
MQSFVLSRPACSCAHGDRRDCLFDVAWSINPHMRIGAVDPKVARAQHGHFARALRSVGARVLQLPFIHGAFDSVFMKDSAIIAGSRAMPTTFRHEERACETQTRVRQLRRAGFSITDAATSNLEGGDVCVLAHRKLALLGHGVRSSRDSARVLSQFLRCDVMPLELVDESMFHLDVALTVLGDDTLVYCPEAFTAGGRAALSSLRFRKVIEVTRAEASRFSLNVVEVDGVIVTGTPSPEIWRELGRRVIVAPLDQFQLAGGSAACLVARVNELQPGQRLAA